MAELVIVVVQLPCKLLFCVLMLSHLVKFVLSTAAGDEVGVEACVPATPIQNHGVGEEPQYRNSVYP